jgi:hypothetical protein
MRRIGLPAHTLEGPRMRENLAPLLGQGRPCRSALVWSCHTDSQDLLGFLPRRCPAKRRHTQGDARHIRRLAHPVALAHPAPRFDRSGTDRHAHLSESSGRGGAQLMPQIGAKLLADGGGRHRVNARCALGDRGHPSPPGFEKLLAGQESARITLKPLDQGLTCRQAIQGAPPLGDHGAARGAARWRQLEDAVGPGDEAVDRHEAGLGAHGGRRHARQECVLELARGPATRRHQALEGRMGLGGALEHAGGGMGEIVKARAAQTVVLEQGGRFLESAAAVFEGGSGATHLGHEAFEPLGKRCSRPGISHRHAHTVDMAQSGSTTDEPMMMGLPGQHGEHLARAQPDAAIDQPDEAVGKGGLLQGHAPHGAGRIDAHDGAPDHPMDDRVRPRGFLDPERPCQQNQDARDGAKADAGLSKELQGAMDYVDLGAGGESVARCLECTPASLRRLEGLGELIALGLDAGLLSSFVALSLPALLGFGLPLLPAVLHCGQWAHDGSLRGHPDGPRPWRGADWTAEEP